VHSRDSFYIVREDVRSGVNDELEILVIPLEIAHQCLKSHIWAGCLGPLNGLGPDGCPAVGKIITID
jgi:hypothetical protein